MRTSPRSTRRTTVTQPLAGKENLANHSPGPTTPSKKARHRLSTAELARLEDVFRQETHPSRQQKKDLAAELGIEHRPARYRDYKTVTIWFQNKRQTSKRGQPPVDENLGRPRADSCLRAVSSPSLNATLGASGVDPTADSAESKGSGDGLNTIAAKAIVKIKPLIATLNALTSRPRGHSESTETQREAPSVKDIDIDPHLLQTSSENSIASPAESNRHDQIAEQEQIKGKPVKWKRIRTLEWACERQAKRRKISREAYVRLGSEEVQDHGDPNDTVTRMDSALSLLSLASTQVGPPKDVMRGASLLLSFKHSIFIRAQVERTRLHLRQDMALQCCIATSC